MAFPVSGILDDFNRADGPIGANWTSPATAEDTLTPTISSNQAAFPDLSNGGYWNVSTFGPDCEVYSSVPTEGGNIVHYLRITSPGALCDGYRLLWNTAFQRLQYFRWDNGVATQLGANDDTVVGPVSGNSVGADMVGSTLTAYINQGSWAAYASRTDSTYSAAGYIGLFGNNATVRRDDFGGGTVVVAPSPPLPSDTPFPPAGRGATW